MSERVALVTGGSRGIGRGIVLALARAGWTTVVNYHSAAQAAKEVAAEVNALGAKAAVVQADVGSAADRERLVQAAGLGTAGVARQQRRHGSRQRGTCCR